MIDVVSQLHQQLTTRFPLGQSGNPQLVNSDFINHALAPAPVLATSGRRLTIKAVAPTQARVSAPEKCLTRRHS